MNSVQNHAGVESSLRPECLGDIRAREQASNPVHKSTIESFSYSIELGCVGWSILMLDALGAQV